MQDAVLFAIIAGLMAVFRTGDHLLRCMELTGRAPRRRSTRFACHPPCDAKHPGAKRAAENGRRCVLQYKILILRCAGSIKTAVEIRTLGHLIVNRLLRVNKCPANHPDKGDHDIKIKSGVPLVTAGIAQAFSPVGEATHKNL